MCARRDRLGASSSIEIRKSDAIPRIWLATEILAIPGSRVARVTVIHPDGEVVSVSKADAGQTNFDVEAIPPDRELQYAGAANVMGTVLANLNLPGCRAARRHGWPGNSDGISYLRRPGDHGRVP